ncbi:MAG: hypothetical protein K8S16_00500 [Bacteroidales bacterium]|nr:hypothetical protein [Bacteroidales bacterium]
MYRKNSYSLIKFLQKTKPNYILIFSAVKKNLALIALCIIALNVIIFDFTYRFWNVPKSVIKHDIKSYYAFLPATFIHKDLSFSFIKTDPNRFKKNYLTIRTPTGKRAIMTSMGLSFLYAPFFLIAHIITPFTDYAPDDYTPPYQLALILSSLFYVIVGLFFLKKILERHFNQFITAITLVAIGIGTNLFYYTTCEAPMSHAYNFSLITIFLYLVILWYETPSFKYTLLIGLTSGLITLIRPTNILVLLILFLYNINSLKGIKTRILFFLKSNKAVLIMIAAFVLVWIPQFIYWNYVSGHFLYFSYEAEGGKFFFDNPQVSNFLFSYRKGWLVYTPIMVFAIMGIPVLYFRLRQYFIAILVYLIVMIYVLSSWWSWWFGGGYGMRSLVDLYGIMAIPFAAFLDFSFSRKKIFGIITTTIILVLIWFSTFQTRQKMNGAIHWIGMTKEAYWNTFLKLHPDGNFWRLLRYPDYKLGRKGIYKTLDPTKKSFDIYDLNEDDKRRILEFETQIRQRPRMLEIIKEKADKRNLSLDSMITLDAMWLYQREIETIVE